MVMTSAEGRQVVLSASAETRKVSDGGSRRDTSGVGNNGCDKSGEGKGKEDEGYVLRNGLGVTP